MHKLHEEKSLEPALNALVVNNRVAFESNSVNLSPKGELDLVRQLRGLSTYITSVYTCIVVFFVNVLFEGISSIFFLSLPPPAQLPQYCILLPPFHDGFGMTGALQRYSELPSSKAFMGALNQAQLTTMEANCCMLLIRRGKLDEAKRLVNEN